MSKPVETDGVRLRLARIAARISSAEMAKRCGVEVRTIGSWERGERTIPRPALAVYVKLTAGDYNYFLGDGPPLGSG